jgi:hypothetical protein
MGRIRPVALWKRGEEFGHDDIQNTR